MTALPVQGIAPAQRLASSAKVLRQTRSRPSMAVHQARASRRACWTSGSSKRRAASRSARAQTCATAPSIYGDLPAIRAMGTFPVFARGVTPIGPNTPAGVARSPSSSWWMEER